MALLSHSLRKIKISKTQKFERFGYVAIMDPNINYRAIAILRYLPV